MRCCQLVFASGRRLLNCNNGKFFKSFFAFIFFILVCVSASGFSQTISIDVDSMAIRQVIKNIERQTDYRFFYTDGLADLNRKVSVHFTAQSIENVLSELLVDTQLSYRIIDDKLVVVAPLESIQQGLIVSGTISDADGPLPGVTIVIKGESRGTTTDSNGQFTITVPGKESILQFSYIGYAAQEEIGRAHV